CQLVLAPAFVSGEQAAPSVVAALRALNESRLVELIIVARGGGSLEELWPFNDERVARAIFASRAPVVSAVGHETDVTIADLVADVRAPTPSIAAELAVPDLQGEVAKLKRYQEQLDALLPTRISHLRQRVGTLQAAVENNSPRARLEHDRKRVTALHDNLETCLRHGLALRRERVNGVEQRLALMNPYATLERGYSITYDPRGHVVSSTSQAQPGDPLEIQVADGRISVETTRQQDGRSETAGTVQALPAATSPFAAQPAGADRG